MKTRSKLAGVGCGFLFFTGLMLILLLGMNWFFVKTFFASNLARIDERVFNAAQFMLPIIMIFIEFWIYDAIRDYFRFRRLNDEPET
ncbi:MAG: hypothetical protein AAFN77_08115 [Planctomycetota bacterium]